MLRKVLCVIALLAAALPTVAESAPKSKGLIFSFKDMYAVNGAFVNAQGMGDPNIRGIPGDFQDWEIKKFIKGSIFKKGRLVIHVRGLVPVDTPISETEIRAGVSCLTSVEDPDNLPNLIIETENVFTEAFPINTDGNANINAKLNLPSPCVAPLVMILNGDNTNGDVWFAITGLSTVGGGATAGGN